MRKDKSKSNKIRPWITRKSMNYFTNLLIKRWKSIKESYLHLFYIFQPINLSNIFLGLRIRRTNFWGNGECSSKRCGVLSLKRYARTPYFSINMIEHSLLFSPFHDYWILIIYVYWLIIWLINLLKSCPTGADIVLGKPLKFSELKQAIKLYYKSS